VALEQVHHAQGQGIVRADHREGDLLFHGEGQQGRQIVRHNGGAFHGGTVARQTFAGDSGVAGRAPQFCDARDWANFQTRACSRPPEPMTKTFMAGIKAGGGEVCQISVRGAEVDGGVSVLRVPS